MKKYRSLRFVIGILVIFSCSEPISTNKDVEQDGRILMKEEQEVFEQLRLKDSLLFELGFNQCDTNLLRRLTSKDFEFYHDLSGITTSQGAFVQSISGLCNMNYKPTRELDDTSLSVHLLKNNGEVYGAIQNGKHRFYGEEEGRPKYLTSTAAFTHLWIIEEGDWRLKRVLSFNHQSPTTE